MDYLGAPWRRLVVVAGLLALASMLGPATAKAASGGQAAASSAAAAIPAAGAAGDGLFRDAYVAYLSGDCVRAAATFQKALDGGTSLPDYTLFYLAQCRSQTGDRTSALSLWQQLAREYPQSVYAAQAQLDAARTELALGHSEAAALLAQQLAASSVAGETAEGARMVLAGARASLGDLPGAYREAESLRQMDPQGLYDAPARDFVYALLRAHPEIAPTASPQYQHEEARLLVREGAGKLALREVQEALAATESLQSRAALVYVKALAYRLLRNSTRERLALLEYLDLAPDGAEAPAALDRLGHLYWQLNDTVQARVMFARLVRGFPHSRLAPEALFSTGRSYEDDRALADARRAYLRLIARYETSEFAQRARFRAPWTLYMAGDYAGAAKLFSANLPMTTGARNRERMLYWRARSLERNGRQAQALALMHQLAASLETNYYPALAASRSGAPLPISPAALVEDPDPAVPVLQGVGNFHLVRALALKRLGLEALEVAELRRLEPEAARTASLRTFLVHELQAAGAWYDAIVAAARMAARGEMDRSQAEHLRYPRAFWTLVKPAAEHARLDPYLVLSLMRQESLFNPKARSVSNARGLMQLMPATAVREAAAGGGALAGPHSLYNPELNIVLGTAHLRHLFAVFSGDRVRALAAYNAGSAAVRHWDSQFPHEQDDEWVENIGYQQTRDYVKRVLGNLREYRLLYGPPSAVRQAHAAERRPSG